MAAGDTRKVLLQNNIGENLIPYTEVASSATVGRVKPDGTTTVVDANGVISVASSIQSGAAAGATAVQPSGVGNAEIEIQKNGTKVDSFTTNQSGSKKTINITVPTSASDVSALPSSTKYGASITVSLNTTDYKLTTTLKDQDGNTLGTAQVIDFPIESVVVNGSYDSTNKKIILTLQNGNTIDIPVGALISGLQSEITSSNKLDADLVDDSSSTNKFVTASNKTTWNGKQDAITGGATTITSSNLTASRALVSNSSGKVAVSDVTSTELGYLDGVTSAIQTQLNNKQATLVSGTSIKTVNSNSLLGSGDVSVGTVKSVNNTSPDANGNVTISTGGTVDQTYDGTSANAQSGVAIAGAGFLQNTATGSNALTIGGTASSVSGGVNVGISSTATAAGANSFGRTAKATGTYSTALGINTSASGSYTTCVGAEAKASVAYAIQIGYGTNSTASTLSIGFNASSSANRKNWQLLDGTTGLIPYERIQGITETRASGQVKIWVGTEAQYTAITTKDANTLYFKTES